MNIHKVIINLMSTITVLLIATLFSKYVCHQTPRFMELVILWYIVIDNNNVKEERE